VSRLLNLGKKTMNMKRKKIFIRVDSGVEIGAGHAMRCLSLAQALKKIARRSIIALIDIEQNEILNKNNIGIRRPGTGLPPVMFEEILGKKSTNKILKGQLLKLEGIR